MFCFNLIDQNILQFPGKERPQKKEEKKMMQMFNISHTTLTDTQISILLKDNKITFALFYKEKPYHQ